MLKSTQWQVQMIDPISLMPVLLIVNYPKPVEGEVAQRFIDYLARPADIDDADWWKKGHEPR